MGKARRTTSSGAGAGRGRRGMATGPRPAERGALGGASSAANAAPTAGRMWVNGREVGGARAGLAHLGRTHD